MGPARVIGIGISMLIIGSLLCGGSRAVMVGSERELMTYMQLSERTVTLSLVG